MKLNIFRKAISLIEMAKAGTRFVKDGKKYQVIDGRRNLVKRINKSTEEMIGKEIKMSRADIKDAVENYSTDNVKSKKKKKHQKIEAPPPPPPKKKKEKKAPAPESKKAAIKAFNSGNLHANELRKAIGNSAASNIIAAKRAEVLGTNAMPNKKKK